MGVLDLEHMSVENTRILNQIYDKYSEEYTEFIDELSRRYENRPFWWSTSLASRNPFASKTYEKICKVLLAIKVLDMDEGINKIIIEDKAVKAVLFRYMQTTGTYRKIELEAEEKKYNVSIKEYAYAYMIKLKEMWQLGCLIRKKSSRKQEVKNKKIVLIETDVFSSCFDSGEYQARDFKNILDYTEEKIYFFPYLFLNNEMSMEELIRYMNQSEKYKFLFRENYLKNMDYVKALAFIGWCRKFCKTQKTFRGIDITEIVHEDIAESLRSRNCIYAILNYFCMRRMAKAGVNIKSLLGWYEGQPSSQGIFMGYRKYYKGGRTIGCIGFPISRNWLCLSPSKEQQRQRVTPEEIGVIGGVFEEIPKRFDPTVKTSIVPAFRLQGVFRDGVECFCESTGCILAVLPYFVESAKTILEGLHCMQNSLAALNRTVLLKNHPTKADWTLESYGVTEFQMPYRFVTGSMDEVVRQTDIVVTGASTSSYEVVLYGKPVIIVSQPAEILMLYGPLEWIGHKYLVAYNAEDIKNAVQYFMDNSPMPVILQKDGKYLLKATRENVALLVTGRPD